MAPECRLSAEISACHGCFVLLQFRRCSLSHDRTAKSTGSRSEIEQSIGSIQYFAIMFDQQHRVAKISQSFQRNQQSSVVARMQSDCRFVEHIQHARQRSSGLAGQSNALRFAAGQRRHRTIERQIIQSDFDEEIQAMSGLIEQIARDLLFVFRSASARAETPSDCDSGMRHN